MMDAAKASGVCRRREAGHSGTSYTACAAHRLAGASVRSPADKSRPLRDPVPVTAVSGAERRCSVTVFLNGIGFENIAHLDIREFLQPDAALKALADRLDIVLEAAQ